MITWIRGESGSGKSYIAKAIQEKYKSIWLDGDMLRRVWTDLKFSDKDRKEQTLRTARLARELDEQGHNVVISTICPEKFKVEAYRITRCKFIEINDKSI